MIVFKIVQKSLQPVRRCGKRIGCKIHQIFAVREGGCQVASSGMVKFFRRDLVKLNGILSRNLDRPVARTGINEDDLEVGVHPL
jgi:hypothetical protein